MKEHGQALHRPSRAGLPARRRKRWLIAAGAAMCWAVLLYLTGSLGGGTALLLLFAALGAACVLALRTLGLTADHPWVRRLATRPWRDGQDVLRLSMRHLADVFVVTPSGTLLAPNAVELRLNPGDFGSLSDVMDIGLVSSSAAEVYVDEVAAHGARFTGSGPAEVRVISDPAVPAGRYLLRQGRPLPPSGAPDPGVLAAGHAAPAMAGAPGAFPHAHDGRTSTEAVLDASVLDPAVSWLPTVTELRPPPVPVLRLVTGGSVVQTTRSGACAGRGAVDLVLPQVPTISREHARFTFSDGQWSVTNLGRNGLALNGERVGGEQPIRHGDLIRWGGQPDAPVSRVEIG